MDNSDIQFRSKHICRYSIACADMHYTELEQRDIFVQDDPENGFRVWAETVGGGPGASVCLCQMFLEYAMFSQSLCDPDQAIHNISAFGANLGLALARFIQSYSPASQSTSKGACGLMCVLEALNVNFEVVQVDSELQFIFASCPLVEVAERTGLCEVDLGLYGVNAMCLSLINALDPDLILHTPQVSNRVFTYELEPVA